MYNTDLPNREDLPTTRQLLQSTAIAVTVAGALLVAVVLPAEYGIDPTRIGRVLGLTQMGEIKTQLSEEAARDNAVTAAQEPASVDAGADAVSARPQTDVSQSIVSVPEAETEAEEFTDTPTWKDEVSVILQPGEAAEIKLVMSQGSSAEYEWSASDGHLNSDLHGDGLGGQATSYRRGRAETSDSGELTAAFDGSHGWFWRNRSDVPVTMTLRVRGAYDEIKRVV